ncbi:MAG TPA: phosphoglycolate phosphatase [Dongiaceae bacterium]|nr:phosphoglycolate phosphatase [Dongiaceae bacterium]
MTPTDRRDILVFDLDGTLVDSAPDIAAAVNALFAELGLPPVELALIRRMIGDGAPVLLERALRHVGAAHKAADLMARFSAHYGENAVKLSTLYPGVAETLAALRAAGCRLGVCTNKPISPTHAVLAAFELNGLIEAVIGGDSMKQRKPQPEPLLEVIRALGGTPDRAVLVGDSTVDLACAEAAGVPAIIVPSGYGMTPPQGGIIADKFVDLPAVIGRLRSGPVTG